MRAGTTTRTGRLPGLRTEERGLGPMPVRSIPDADGRERVAGFMNFSTPSPVNTGQMQETPARPFLPKAAGNIILHKKKYSQDKNEVESPHSEFLLTCCLPACLLLLTAAYFRLLRLTSAYPAYSIYSSYFTYSPYPANFCLLSLTWVTLAAAATSGSGGRVKDRAGGRRPIHLSLAY